MNYFLKKTAIAMMAAVMIFPVYGTALSSSQIAGTVDVYAKSASKLSKKKLTMTDSGKTYSLKLTTSEKKSKISWYESIKAGTAESAEPCISMKVSGDKKKVTITPLRNGSGTITCKAGKKKLKCSYIVKLPDPVVSRFSDLADYLEINGTYASGVKTKDFGQFDLSGAKCTVYGNFLTRDQVEFDISGFYKDTSDYFTVTFRLGSDGNVTNVIVKERVGYTDIYSATITSRQASAFKRGCKDVNFYTQLEPGASQYQASCESMAQKNFDISLQCINSYLTQTLGFSIQNIGFTNYK